MTDVSIVMPVYNDMENIKIGNYQFELLANKRLVFKGVNDTGNLTYCDKYEHYGQFRLFMPISSTYGHFINSIDFMDVCFKQTTEGIVFEFRNPRVNGVEYDIKVNYRIMLNPELNVLEYIASVENNCRYMIKEIWITGFEGMKQLNGADCINLLSAKGKYNDFVRSTEVFGWEFMTYGKDRMAIDIRDKLPFLVLEAGDISIYLGSHDETKRAGIHLLQRHPARNNSGYIPRNVPLNLSYYLIYHVALQPNNEIEVGKLVIDMRKGDWHTYKNLYRGWFDKIFPLCAKTKYFEKYDGWQHKAFILNDGKIINRFADMPEMYRKLNETTGLTCMMIYGHTEEGADLSEPDIEPAKKGGGLNAWQKSVKEIQKMGGKVFVMTKANRASTRAVEWEKKWRKSIVKNEWGLEQYVSWQVECGIDSLASGRYSRPNGWMCMFDKHWQDFIVKRLAKLAEIGVDGIQLDEIQSAESLCFNVEHGHKDPAIEAYSGLSTFMKKLRKECTKYNPRFIIGGEELRDYFSQWLEFSFTRWSCSNAEAGVTPGRMFRFFFPEVITHTRIQSYEIDQVSYALLLGTPIDIEVGALRDMIYEHALELKRIQEMLQIRRRYGKFFYDGIFQDTLNFKVSSAHDVNYASHRAKDGDDLLIIINRSEDNIEVLIEPKRRYKAYNIISCYGTKPVSYTNLDEKFTVISHNILTVECQNTNRRPPCRARSR